ncbi:hypothetical protein [Colwellia sp. E150_009]
MLLIAQSCCISNASANTVNSAFLGTHGVGGNQHFVYRYMDHNVVRQYFEKGNKGISLIWQGSGEYSFEIEKRNGQNPWQSCGSGDEGNYNNHFEVSNNYGNPPDEYFNGGCRYGIGEAITEVRIRRGGGSWFVVKVPLIAPFLPRKDLIVQSTVNATGNITYVNLKRMFGTDGFELQFHSGNGNWQSLPVEQITLNKNQNRLEIKDLLPEQYYLRLRSTRNGAFSKWIDKSNRFKILANIPLGKPTNVLLEPIIYAGYQVTWQPVFGATEYFYELAPKKTRVYEKNTRSYSEPSVTVLNSLGINLDRYWIRVRARTAEGTYSEWGYSKEVILRPLPGLPIPKSLVVEPLELVDSGFFLIAEYKGPVNGQNPVEQYRFEIQVNNGDWFPAYYGRKISLRLSWDSLVEGLTLGTNNKLHDGLYRFRVRTEGKYDPEGYHSDWQLSEYYPIGNSVSSVPSPSVVNTHLDANNLYVYWDAVSNAKEYQVIITDLYRKEMVNKITSNLQIDVRDLHDSNYKVKVRTIDEQGNFSQFNVVPFTIDAVPSPVINVTTQYWSSGSNPFISVNWDSTETDVQYYIEYRYNSGQWQELSNTANKSNPLFQPLSGTYLFRVSARSNDSRKFSGWVNGPLITVDNNKNTLAMPSGVYAAHIVNPNSEHMHVNWTLANLGANAGATYEIQKLNINLKIWGTVKFSSSTSVNLSNTTPGAHYYRVRASRDGIHTPYQHMSRPIRVLQQSNEITPPHSLKVVSYTGNTKHLSISWQSPSTNGHFFLEKRLNGGPWEELTNTVNFSTVIFNPKEDTFYEFRVKTRDTLNGVRYFSAWSDIVSYDLVSIPQTPILTVEKVNKSQGNIQLSWTMAEDVNYYQLYQSTSSRFVRQPESISGDVSSLVIDRPVNGEYSFRLDACNTAGCSESVPVSVTVNKNINIKTELLGTVLNANN